jgi:hypothetical protein
MSFNADNIQVGPGRIFLGVTQPSSGAWKTHTAGVPSDGVEVGYTEGDLIVRRPKEVVEIMAEQAYSPVMTFPTREDIEVEFTALERVYETLYAAFDNVSTVNDVTRMGFKSGGQFGFALRTQTVMVTSPRPNQAGRYEVLFIYKAYQAEGVEYSYKKGGAATVRMRLKGLNDTSRTAGDQLYQWSVEKA